jgi:hypothetical protein
MIKFTAKQLEILSIIKRGNKDEEPCTVYDLLELTSYDCKRDAMLHSVKILIDNGYVERLGRAKRGASGSNMTFGITTEGSKII